MKEEREKLRSGEDMQEERERERERLRPSRFRGATTCITKC
jgi:hypothetical protein